MKGKRVRFSIQSLDKSVNNVVESEVLDCLYLPGQVQGKVHGGQPQISIMSFLLVELPTGALGWVGMDSCMIVKEQKNAEIS